MKIIAKADVVLALGTRLGPFGTLPQHGLDYWPKNAKIIQVDSDHRMLGLVKQISVGVCGDAKAAARALSHRLANRDVAARRNASERLESVKAEKTAWEEELGQWTHEKDPWSLEVSKGSKRMHPRQMLRELEKAMPKDAMVSTDIGNICSVSNSYLRFSQPNSMFAAMSFGNCGYAFPTIIGTKVAEPERPAIAYVGDGAWGMSFGELLTCVREDIPVTAVVFNNEQWGAEKKNQVDFYANRFEGVNLEEPELGRGRQDAGRRRRRGREPRRRRRGAGEGRRCPEAGQDHRARDAGDEGAGRPLPPRRAEEAQAPAEEIQAHQRCLKRFMGKPWRQDVQPLSLRPGAASTKSISPPYSTSAELISSRSAESALEMV